MIGGANDSFVLYYNGINYQWETRANRLESAIDEVNVPVVIQAVASAQKKGQTEVKIFNEQNFF